MKTTKAPRKLMLGFAGEMAAGKGTATDLVKRWYPETPSFRFSDSLREFYRLLSEDLVYFQGRSVPKQFPLDTQMRCISILQQSFGLDLASAITHQLRSRELYEFLSWLIGEFVPPHKRYWPTAASTPDLQAISTAVRTHFGEDTLERAILVRVDASNSGSPIVVIEGIRRLVDVHRFMSDPASGFRLTYIEADPSVRFSRHIVRNEKDGDSALSFEQFCALGNAEAEQQIQMLRPHAHAIIDNSGRSEHLEHTLRVYLNAWLTH